MRDRRLVILLLGMLVAGVVGCRGDAASDQLELQPSEQTYEDGLLRATVRFDRTEMATSDRLTLEIVTALDTGFELDPIELEDAFGSDWIVSRSRSSRLEDASESTDRDVRRHQFVLEPYEPGSHDAPAFEVAYRAIGSAPDSEPKVLTTAPVRIEVRSVLGVDDGFEPGIIQGVVEPRSELALPWWTLALAGGVLLIAAVVLFLWLRRRKQEERERLIRIAAHEIALARLREVMEAQYVERGDVQRFYVEVSSVLRRYIEDRFGLRAPEQTTQEFLDASRNSGALWADDVRVLERFLAHCDLVKFAQHAPDQHQIHETLDTVRDFIDRTRVEDKQVIMDEQGRRRGSTPVATPEEAPHA